MTQLVIPGTAYPLVANHSRELQEAAQRALERVTNPDALNTRRTYESAWRAWLSHCSGLHVPAHPIEPSHLVVYLEHRTDLAPNSVRVHLAALCRLDQEMRISAEHPNPQSLREHMIVRRWLKGWGRDNPRAARKQAPALTRAEVSRILFVAQDRGRGQSGFGHVLRYARDRCILLFGVVGGFRGDELAQLDASDVCQGPRGLICRLKKSKTNQHGNVETKGLMPQGHVLRCPVDAWITWSNARGDWPGPLFVAIDRQGTLGSERLSTDAIYRLLVARARAAGIKMSAHSMRASMATLARSRGASLERIADQGGWKSLDTARGYCRQIDMFEDNASEGLLDGD